MSVLKDLKTVLKNRLNSLDTIGSVYTYEEFNVTKFPAVFITSDALEGNFVTTTENRRIFVFKVSVLYPLGQNLPKDASQQKLEHAEETLYNVFDQITTDLDQNSFSADFANISDSDSTFLYIEAADAEWGFFNYAGGKARAIQITLRIAVDFNVTS